MSVIEPVARAEISDKYLAEIFGAVDSDLREALNSLQDYVRDFAPGLKGDVLQLRTRHTAYRERRQQGSESTRERLEISAAIRKIASEVDARRQADGAPPSLNAHGADAVTTGAIDAIRSDFARQVWDRPESVICRGRDLRKAYAKSRFQLEIDDLSFRAGEITAIFGSNASGKTTLLRVLMGDLAPDAGAVTYAVPGHKRGWPEIKRHIAYVPQFPEKWPGALRQTLNFVAAVHGIPQSGVDQAVDWNVARYGLDRYSNADWGEVSAGTKVRFELVRALLSRPRVLFLDEPLAYLDIVARRRFLKDLQTVARSLTDPVPIVLTSQHVDEVEGIADQVVVLEAGRCREAYRRDETPPARTLHAVELWTQGPIAAIDEVLSKLSPHPGEARRTSQGYVILLTGAPDVPRTVIALLEAFPDTIVGYRNVTDSVKLFLDEELLQ